MERKAQAGAAGPNPRPKPSSQVQISSLAMVRLGGTRRGTGSTFPTKREGPDFSQPWFLCFFAHGSYGQKRRANRVANRRTACIWIGATFKSDSALVRQGVVGTRLQGVFENAPTTEFERNMRVPVFQLDLSGSSSSGLHD